MRRHHSQDRRSNFVPVDQLAVLSRHPVRALVFAASGLFLAWLIATNTLSYAVAETSPEFALWLNPRQPVALLLLAERAKSRLLKLVAVDVEATASIDNGAGGPDAAFENAPLDEPLSEKLSAAKEREVIRQEIRSLASRIIASETLEARAFRLLAEGTTEPAKLRPLMEDAMQRSRRASVAVFWLMNDSFEQKNFSDTLEKADILLRTKMQLFPSVVIYLNKVAATPNGRALLIPKLAENPNWRTPFLEALAKAAGDPELPLEMLVALEFAGSAPSPKELTSFLNILVTQKHPQAAYNGWLQFLPHGKLASLGLLNNGNFADDPGSHPFEWSLRPGQNTTVDFLPLGDDDNGRALRFGFGLGRAQFPELSQLVLLAPGRYRLSGSFQGLLRGNRGLRWQLRCMGAKTPLAETDMIYGAPGSWRVFTLDVEVPDEESCRAQRIRLYHDARSPSEQLISGEISFRGLQLVRNEPPA